MKTLTVVARFTAKKGQEANLEKALRKVVQPTHQESGCQHFSVQRDNNNPRVFITLEAWASAEAHQKHLKEPFVKELLDKLPQMTEGNPEVGLYSVLPEGNNAKGKVPMAA